MTRAERPEPAPQRRWVRVARWAFLALVLAFAWWGLRGREDELLAALRSISPWRVLVALALVLVGIAATGSAWLALLGAFGRRLPGAAGRAVFFLGQLGKYIPGGVWSMGAHAELARAHDVPVRTTVSTSLVFLGVNLATGSVVASVSALLGATTVDVPRWVLWTVLAGALVALTPPVVNRGGSLLAGADGLRVTAGVLVRIVAVQTLTWSCYAAAVTVLAPAPDWHLLGVAAGAVTASYAIGVLVVVAPAGLGARDVTLVALLAPALGLPTATAVALVTRVLHTAGDLLLALGAWSVARRGIDSEGQSAAASHMSATA